MGGSIKREVTYVYLWPIHVDVWQKPTQFYKAIILQLKNKFKIKKVASEIRMGSNGSRPSRHAKFLNRKSMNAL